MTLQSKKKDTISKVQWSSSHPLLSLIAAVFGEMKFSCLNGLFKMPTPHWKECLEIWRKITSSDRVFFDSSKKFDYFYL